MHEWVYSVLEQVGSALEWYQPFQTSVVGLLGFTGVIATLRWNARTAREGRRETFERERASLRAGLIEELKLLRAVCSSACTYCEDAHERNMDREDDEPPVFISRYEEPQIFASLADKIGLLPPIEVACIIRAHMAARFAWRRAEGYNQSERSTAGHICVIPEKFADTGSEFGLAMNQINHAFKILKVRPEKPDIVLWGLPPLFGDTLTESEIYEDC
jgi:hypothetical protein